ncbi:MAG: hypothetical protein EZS26_003203 [Candidatus Ordinivivax streblomastigis]|uniref:Uncharacterized protein n=1 Tax=Candidatus Ordinivivax streblomastigis TaxID=2540710 RepID=A0A5M8NUV1_9BACT|nr:MAG: hypothetical protein EZS26_003203 [Candidatus Ordinivivax streblomastigis]
MNKNAVWLLAFVCTFLFSCSSDDFDAGNQKDGMVDFTISTSIPQGITTYASGDGGVTNVKNHDLRYILEVWTQEEPPRLAYRDYRIVPAKPASEVGFVKTEVEFSARLLAMKYDFVFWADFVKEIKLESGETLQEAAAGADFYYKTNNGESKEVIKSGNYKGLTDIKMNITSSEYYISNDARDAFYATKTVDLRTENAIGPVTLTRPFGKYRLVAIDNSDDIWGGEPMKAQINYTGTSFNYDAKVKLPGGFNALDGTVNTDEEIAIDVTNSDLFSNDITQECVLVGDNPYPNAYVLGFDYVFAALSQTISFDVITYSVCDGKVQTAHRELSSIPIVANQLTTIVGNFFTSEFKCFVDVSNAFEDKVFTTIDNKISADASGNYEIIIPKANASLASLTYTLSDEIKDNATITVMNEGDDKYTGSVTLDIKKPASNSIVTFNTPGATVSVLGTIGSLTTKDADAINVDMKLSNITNDKITFENTEGVKTKVFWAPYDGDQLYTALSYAADKNSGVNLMANCTRNVSNNYAFAIGATNKEQYKGYVFNGNGYIVSGNATNQLLQCYATATIKNVTFDAHNATNGASGLAFLNAENAVIENVTAINSPHAGVIINKSTVTATNLTTRNNTWGGVNLEPTAHFTLKSGTFAEANKIWTDSNEPKPYDWVTLPNNWDWTYIINKSTGQINYTPKNNPEPLLAILITTVNAILEIPSINLELGEGTFSIGKGVATAKNLSITGSATGTTIIEAIDPTKVEGIGNGKYPVICINGENVVTIKNVLISAKNTTGNEAPDGITIIDGGTLDIDNVTFDGLFHVSGHDGVQSGRCITAYGSSKLTVANSTFKRFNKNGIHMNGTSDAKISNSTFIGNGVRGVIGQNGVVFVDESKGSVTNCTFSDFVYRDTDHDDDACGVLRFNPSNSSNITLTNNTYKNNDIDIY